MVKAWVLVLSLFFSGAAFANASSIEMGGVGTKTTAKLHIIVDENNPDPRCMNCIRFTILTDDAGPIGSTQTSQVLLIADHPGASAANIEIESELLKLSSIQRNPMSPKETRELTYSLPTSPDTQVKDLEFRVLALKRKCMNPTVATCKELEITVQGAFKGEDVQKLQKASLRDLLRN